VSKNGYLRTFSAAIAFAASVTMLACGGDLAPGPDPVTPTGSTTLAALEVAVATPTLVMPGAQDRAIPLWAQKKMLDIFPNSRWELIPEAGHVVYLERPDVFFPTLKAFMRAKSCGISTGA